MNTTGHHHRHNVVVAVVVSFCRLLVLICYCVFHLLTYFLCCFSWLMISSVSYESSGCYSFFWKRKMLLCYYHDFFCCCYSSFYSMELLKVLHSVEYVHVIWEVSGRHLPWKEIHHKFVVRASLYVCSTTRYHHDMVNWLLIVVSMMIQSYYHPYRKQHP